MSFCEQCDHLMTPRRFETPTRLGGAVRAVNRYLADHTLEEDDVWQPSVFCPPLPLFQLLRIAPPWPDSWEYHFRCTLCDQLFCFHATTHPGIDALWTPCEEQA